MMARSTTRSNQRPDTLMQDRSPPARRNPLATHGRTIHWVIFDQVRRGLPIGAFRSAPRADIPPAPPFYEYGLAVRVERDRRTIVDRRLACWARAGDRPSPSTPSPLLPHPSDRCREVDGERKCDDADHDLQRMAAVMTARQDAAFVERDVDRGGSHGAPSLRVVSNAMSAASRILLPSLPSSVRARSKSFTA